MGQIVAQAEAEQQAEIKAQNRAEWYARVRKACALLFVATLLIFAYTFQGQYGAVIAAVMPARLASLTGSNPTNSISDTNSSAAPTGKAAVILQGAQQNAATRDALIDSLAK